MINHRVVESSVFQHFATQFSASPFHVDAAPFDPSSSETWVQLEVGATQSGPVRKTGKDVLRVRIIAHCFARLASDRYTSLAIADQVAALLDHGVIDLRDYDESGEPSIGTLTLHEVDIRDQSLALDESLRVDWQHVTVSVSGFAIEK